MKLMMKFSFSSLNLVISSTSRVLFQANISIFYFNFQKMPKNKTKQNKTKQNKTKQNKTKQNKTKQNKTMTYLKLF